MFYTSSSGGVNSRIFRTLVFWGTCRAFQRRGWLFAFCSFGALAALFSGGGGFLLFAVLGHLPRFSAAGGLSHGRSKAAPVLKIGDRSLFL